MNNIDLIPEVDFDVIKKILSSDEYCKRLVDFDKNTDFFDTYYTKEEYLVSIDCYVYEMIKRMISDYKPNNFVILNRYFNYFVKGRYNSPIEYFSNPVLNNIHMVNLGRYDETALKFLQIRNSSNYLSMLNLIKNYYTDIIVNDLPISFETFSDMFIFFSSGKLDDLDINKSHCDYFFSKLLNTDYIDKKLPVKSFQFYFNRFTQIIAKLNGLSCKCSVSYIPPSDGKICRGLYLTYPNNSLTLNSDMFSDTMKSNFRYFETIFHEIDHCRQATKTKSTYTSLKIAKDTILHMFLGDKYYVDNYDAISIESDAALNGYVESLRYVKSINPEYYNLLVKSAIEEVKSRIKTLHIDQRYVNDLPVHLDQVFNTVLTNEQRKLYISKFPILEYEYFSDGKRKLPIDLLLSVNHLSKNNVPSDSPSIKMCKTLIRRQNLSTDEIVETYRNSCVMLDDYDEEFEKSRFDLLGISIPKKLELIFNASSIYDITNIETEIIKILISNIMILNSQFNNGISSDKINYLNLRIKSDLVILDTIVKKFKSINKFRGVSLDLEKLKESNIKKGI